MPAVLAQGCWAERGHAWLHAAGTAGARRVPRGGEHGFVPGRLPGRRLRSPTRPGAPRVPPAPHEEPSPAWHP